MIVMYFDISFTRLRLLITSCIGAERVRQSMRANIRPRVRNQQEELQKQMRTGKGSVRVCNVSVMSRVICEHLKENYTQFHLIVKMKY